MNFLLLQSVTLKIEKAVSGVRGASLREVPETNHENTCSPAPAPNPDKGSRRPIVARSNLRLERMQKLTCGRHFRAESWFRVLERVLGSSGADDSRQEVVG